MDDETYNEVERLKERTNNLEDTIKLLEQQVDFLESQMRKNGILNYD